MKRVILILTVAALFTACAKREKTEVITVASEKTFVEDDDQHGCLLVKHEGFNDWELWCGDIEGFNYERGHEYVLRIKQRQVVNPAPGQPATVYVLVKEISKTAKESENMPLRKIKEKIEELGEDVEEHLEVVKENISKFKNE